MAEPVQKITAGTVAVQGGPMVETEAAKAALELERLVQQTEIAARDWGVRPDHLEGRFISALLSTLTWLGRLIQAATADLKAAAKENRTASAAIPRPSSSVPTCLYPWMLRLSRRLRHHPLSRSGCLAA